MNDSDTYKSYLKRTVYVGGLAEEVDDKVLKSAFIPFGDIVDVQVRSLLLKISKIKFYLLYIKYNLL